MDTVDSSLVAAKNYVLKGGFISLEILFANKFLIRYHIYYKVTRVSEGDVRLTLYLVSSLIPGRGFFMRRHHSLVSFIHPLI